MLFAQLLNLKLHSDKRYLKTWLADIANWLLTKYQNFEKLLLLGQVKSSLLKFEWVNSAVCWVDAIKLSKSPFFVVLQVNMTKMAA